MDYGEILAKAWRITWKFKVLWIFGILAACGTSRASFNFNNRFNSGQTNPNGLPFSTPNLPPEVLNPLERFVHLFDNPGFVWEFVAGLLALICVIVLVEIFIGTMGRIGLIRGSAQADAGAEQLAFGVLWHESLRYFWRVFWLSFLIGAPFALAVVALAVGALTALIPLARQDAAGASFLLVLLPVMCVFLCVIFILAILLGFISTQAERAIVLEGRSILGGFRRGWEIFTGHLGPILLVWLILLVISFVAGIVIALPLLVVLVPMVVAFLASMNNLNFSFTPWLVAFVCVICAYAPLSWLANGILMTYLQSAWTLTFLRLTAPGPEAPAPLAPAADA